MNSQTSPLQRLDPADAVTIKALHDVYLLAHAADDPDGPPWPARTQAAHLSGGPPLFEPRETWFVPAPGSGPGVTAWYSVRYPDKENLSWAILDMAVRPAGRRKGLGTLMLRHAAQRAADAGRQGLTGMIQHGSAGDAFAARAGATRGIDEIRRVLDLRKVPAGTWRQFLEPSPEAGVPGSDVGYRLERWEGATPEGYLTGIADMFNTMNDAPRNVEEDPSFYDAERVRKDDQRNAVRGGRRWIVAAFHPGSGELAGYTELRVPDDGSGWGFQGNTAVARRHRGHRLGLLLKAQMLELIAAREPGVERITTWNAAANRHMIAINEQLGFEVSGPASCFVDLLVSALLPQS
jgi:GNAT superfamily N-acetyltransferase